jgi:hypothetical protein
VAWEEAGDLGIRREDLSHLLRRIRAEPLPDGGLTLLEHRGGDPGSGCERLRVLDVVPFEEEDESPFVGLLQVQAA